MQIKSLSLLFLGACAVLPSSATGDDDDGSGMTDPGGGGSGGGGGGSGAGDWRSIALVDDGNIHHADNDRVTALLFTAPDRGFIATQGADDSFFDGGAVFGVNGATVSLAFSGKAGGPSLLGTVDFTGLEQTPSGFVAMAYAADVVRGDTSGHFSIMKNGNLGGIEPAIGYRETAAGTTIIRKTGVVSLASTASGPGASFTDVWAPNATQRIPANLPAEMCQGGPLGTGSPTTRYSTYIGNNLIAYTSDPEFDPQICISTDGGKSFYPSRLEVDDAAVELPPTGVVFASASTGITWWGSSTAKPYIQRTTDAGKTWHNVGVPAALAGHGLALNAGFFAPDGQHAWIVGYDHDSNKAVGLASTDAGATWSAMSGLGDAELFSGFALDATHVWLGGAKGTVLARD
ncbi:MAG: hypothetical protein ABI678_01125 [Kofleriaceae bacterium]